MIYRISEWSIKRNFYFLFSREKEIIVKLKHSHAFYTRNFQIFTFLRLLTPSFYIFTFLRPSILNFCISTFSRPRKIRQRPRQVIRTFSGENTYKPPYFSVRTSRNGTRYRATPEIFLEATPENPRISPRASRTTIRITTRRFHSTFHVDLTAILSKEVVSSLSTLVSAVIAAIRAASNRPPLFSPLIPTFLGHDSSRMEPETRYRSDRGREGSSIRRKR